jgi:hypothetical protein
MEAIEDAVELLTRNAWPVVADGDDDAVLARAASVDFDGAERR